jgi:bifunctional non-homologous end joining protein LigD
MLDYYNRVAAYLLPYLKDRPLWTRRDADTLKAAEEVSVSTLFSNLDVPSWTKREAFNEDQQKDRFLCNDKDHLLLLVEAGCLEFDHGLSRTKHATSPDYVIIIIDSPDSDITKAIDVAAAAKEVLDGLQLPSFIMTDGISGFQIYIPLEPKSDFETGKSISEYICKLIRIKIPDLVSLKESDKHFSGKVALDYSRNQPGKGVVAPYSLVPGQLAVVATPLEWDELEESLRLEDFTHETIFTRLKQKGDPFSSLSKKKVNADTLLEKLENNYAFLF